MYLFWAKACCLIYLLILQIWKINNKKSFVIFRYDAVLDKNYLTKKQADALCYTTVADFYLFYLTVLSWVDATYGSERCRTMNIKLTMLSLVSATYEGDRCRAMNFKLTMLSWIGATYGGDRCRAVNIKLVIFANMVYRFRSRQNKVHQVKPSDQYLLVEEINYLFLIV